MKIAVVGKKGSGKSSFLRTYFGKSFENSYIPDKSINTLKTSEHEFYDTPNDNQLTHISFSRAHAIYICVSLEQSEQQIENEIKAWKQAIKNAIGEERYKATSIAIVATKSDLIQKKDLDRKTGIIEGLLDRDRSGGLRSVYVSSAKNNSLSCLSGTQTVQTLENPPSRTSPPSSPSRNKLVASLHDSTLIDKIVKADDDGVIIEGNEGEEEEDDDASANATRHSVTQRSEGQNSDDADNSWS